MSSVLLINPKHIVNVANVLRTCAIFGIDSLYWTGDRVPPKEAWGDIDRLPREMRMKVYNHVHMQHVEPRINFALDCQPISVELNSGAESLPLFTHPENALYVFGPEDGDVPQGIRRRCWHFVQIPTCDTMGGVPLNLAAAVNITLYDRLIKNGQN